MNMIFPMPRIAWSCILAAVFSLLSDILLVGSWAMERTHSTKQHDGNYDTFTQLEPAYIQADWEFRPEQFRLQVTAGLVNAASWVVLCIPLIQVTWMLSQNGSHLIGLHSAMGVLVMMGANAEFTSHAMAIGAFTAMDWLARDFNLEVWLESSTQEDPDNVGWRSLEMMFLSVKGMLVWVEALEHLFLAVIFFLMYLSIQRQDTTFGQKRLLSRSFGNFGAVLSFLCFVLFSFEVLRPRSLGFFIPLAFVISVIMRLFLWPLWLLLLGRRLANVNATTDSTATTTPRWGHKQQQSPSYVDNISPSKTEDTDQTTPFTMPAAEYQDDDDNEVFSFS